MICFFHQRRHREALQSRIRLLLVRDRMGYCTLDLNNIKKDMFCSLCKYIKPLEEEMLVTIDSFRDSRGIMTVQIPFSLYSKEEN